MRRRPPRFLSRAAIAALAGVMGVIGASCGETRERTDVAPATTGAADPWAVVESSFLDACAAAEDHPDEADEAAYCRCVYVETVEFYGTPDAMADATADRPGGGRATDPLLEPAFAGCAEAHLN